MGIIDILTILTIVINIVFIALMIIKRQKIKLLIFALVVIDLLILFELCYGTIFVKPVLTINGDKKITIEVGTNYKEQGAVLTHHSRNLSHKIIVTNNIDKNKVGTYEVKYYAKIFFTEVEKTRKIEIVDTIPPVLDLFGSRDVKIMEGRDFYEDGFIATDNYDGDITQNVTIERQDITPTQYKMSYKIKDTSNNETVLDRVINIVPKTKATDVNKNGVIYLTFDDGPSQDITPFILDILKEQEVKATFFIINFEGPEQEALVRRIVEEGHAIGIHGYSHDYKTIYSSDEAFMNNVKTLHDKIFAVTGVDTKIMRFPGGSSNTVSRKYSEKIMTRLSQKVITEGYMYYDWNVTSGDSGDVFTKQAVYRNVTRRISKNQPNIVLLHDYADNKKTLNALEDIIKYAKKREYTFETINTETPYIMHDINN